MSQALLLLGRAEYVFLIVHFIRLLYSENKIELKFRGGGLKQGANDSSPAMILKTMMPCHRNEESIRCIVWNKSPQSATTSYGPGRIVARHFIGNYSSFVCFTKLQ